MALPDSTIELNLNMDSASPGLPMVVLMLIPPNTSRVMSTSLYIRVNLHLLVVDCIFPNPFNASEDKSCINMVGLLMEPPHTLVLRLCIRTQTSPMSLCRVPPCCALKALTLKKAISVKKVLILKKALSSKKAMSPQFKGNSTCLHGVPPKNQCPVTDVTTEAGVSSEALLVLPPIPRDTFEGLMTMFDRTGDK